MIAYLSKSDASEGFNQIINFLNGSSIKYALTVNPNIYVSCIKQFWTTVALKQMNDVIRLQALVDKKRVVVTEGTIQEALRLDDEEGVECLPNKEIFAELARMGYEKPSTKLLFYKAFFSSHWKKQVGDLSTHTSKYTSPALTQKVFANMRRVGKLFSEVETPLFESMLVEQHVDEKGDAKGNVEEVNAGDAAEGDVSAAHGEVPTVTEEPSIPSPTPPISPPQPSQDIPSTSQGRMIAEMDHDTDVVLKDDKEVADEAKKLADLITEVVTAASETITPASTNIIAAEAQVYVVTLATAPSRRRKGVVIRDPGEESTTSTIIPAKTKSKDKGKGILVEEPKPDEAIDHVNKKEKEDNAVKRYQAIKRKPQTEAQARKNVMVYLKNVVGFKMEYFKGISYDDLHPIFERYFDSNVAFLIKSKEQLEEKESRALKIINETPTEKSTKRKKLDEEVEELKRHLQIVPNEDGDVYKEATPLARKGLLWLCKNRLVLWVSKVMILGHIWQGCWFCVGVSSGGRGGDVGRVEKEQGRRESAVAGWAGKTGVYGEQ
nr:hypothetical protein [Tanacetum cinerariifolium]